MVDGENEMLIEKEKLQKAKEKIGDRTPFLIAETLDLKLFDPSNLKSLCPVHQEDTPSFIYNPKAYSFHCFGCGCNIDIIDAYVMSGDTYLEAAEKTFEEAGMVYSFGEKGIKTHRGYRYPQQTPLRDRSIVNQYMATRKISEKTLDHCDVREDEHGNAVFNYYDTNDVLTMVKYRPARKIDKSKGEAKNWCQKGADTRPLLFNMNRVNISQPLLITEGECFPGDAEILTPDGWVRFNEYHGQDVYSVCADDLFAGTWSKLRGGFVRPVAIINEHYEGFLSFIAADNYVSCVTGGHNIVTYNALGFLEKTKARKLPDDWYKSAPITTSYSGDGFFLTMDEVELSIAISENCSYDKSTGEYRLLTTEKRKRRRLRRLLKKLSVSYVETPVSDYGFKLLFKIPSHVHIEPVSYSWVSTTSEIQKLVILRRFQKWTAGYACKLDNANVMQTIAHTSGQQCSVKYQLSTLDGSYRVSITGKKKADLNNITYDTQYYSGPVYCVTVPSGMILVRQYGTIFVTGNCDAMAAIESGYTNAVSVPLGSQNHHWIEENMDWLDQFSEIIICSDNDKAGYQMAKDVCPRLGSWRTKVVDIPPIDEATGRHIKDLNELLYYKGKEAVMNAILSAKESPIDSVMDLSDVEDVNISDLDGIYFGIESLDRELFKLFFGTLTLVTGTPGSGKTSFLYQLICNALEQNRGAWIFSRELPDFMSKAWMNYLLAGPRNVEEHTGKNGAVYWVASREAKEKINDCYRGQWFVYKNEWPNDIESIQESMEASARKYGSKLFLLDNLMTIDLHSSDENKYDKQTELVNWLIQFASKFNVCVILVAHPRKIPSGTTPGAVALYDIGGTSNLPNLAHRTLSLRRVRQDEREQGTSKFSQYSCVVSVTKDRMRGRAGFELGLYYDEACRRFFTNYEEYDRRYKWDDKIYTTRVPCAPLDMESEVYGVIQGGG